VNITVTPKTNEVVINVVDSDNKVVYTAKNGHADLGNRVR